MLVGFFMVILLGTGASVTAFADHEAKDASGKCGEALEWKYEAATGTLTITGEGNLDVTSSAAKQNGYSFPVDPVTKVILPAGWNGYEQQTLLQLNRMESLEDYEVAEDNEDFASAGGVLYTENMTELLSYPKGKTETSFAMPDTVEKVCEGAFYFGMNQDCPLSEIIFSENLSQIEPSTFGYLPITSVSLPKTLSRVYNQAFTYCDKLTSIQVEVNCYSYFSYDGVLYEKVNMYDESGKQTSFIELVCYPAGKTDAEFQVPSGVSSIGWNAFSNANELQTLKLPVTVTEIGSGAFTHCNNLTGIYIPGSVTKIGNGIVFNDNGTAVTIYGTSGSAAEAYVKQNAEDSSAIGFQECADPAAVMPEGPFAGENDTVHTGGTETDSTPGTNTQNPDPGQNIQISGGTEKNDIPAAEQDVLTKEIGQKALKLSASKLPLQLKKSTKVLKVAKMAEGDAVVKWSSSKPGVVFVNKKTGALKAKKTGKATITVTMKSGATAACKVTVQKKAVKIKKLTLSKKNVVLKKGKTYVLKAAKTPLTSLEKVTYKSSDKKVAAVSAKGVIKAKKKGTATITVKSPGGVKKTCKVTVK